IRTVHAGTAVFAASATRELLRRYEDTTQAAETVPPAFAELTPREREIFDLAAKGMSNSEIASHEFVSEATVKTHISRVLTKLELRDRVRLVVFAHEHGLVAKD
ncbi:MAG: response regulator transcription factor, partial [Curtobacterium sp.]